MEGGWCEECGLLAEEEEEEKRDRPGRTRLLLFSLRLSGRGRTNEEL